MTLRSGDPSKASSGWKTLYVCYFGIREPLVQTQVLPYLFELLKDGYEISLLTFEPELSRNWTVEELEREKQRLLELGIDWHCLGYHKRLSVLATAYDIFRGAWFIRGMIRERDLDVLHTRVHVATLMGALARRSSRRRSKLLFDIRGFFPEEYTDAGIWPENGWLYRLTKRVERWLMKEADAFVVLTERARNILFPESRGSGRDRFGRPVEVIPCCVDLERFKDRGEASREEIRATIGAGDRPVVAYVGSFGGWYLSGEMYDFLKTAREVEPRTFSLILTQRDKEKVVSRLQDLGFTSDDFMVESVAPAEIPQFLKAADYALSFIKACYSKQAASPTKIAEYLACGLPIVANRGVGDLDELIADEAVGVLLNGFDTDSYMDALDRVKRNNGDEEQRTRCMAAARRHFDLTEVGGPKYRALYRRLLGKV